MIRLPSIEQITAKASATFSRFPLILTLAITGTIGVIYLVDVAWDQQEGSYLIRNFCWVAALSISLFLAIRLVSESREWSRLIRLLARTVGVALLAIYYMLLPEDFGPSGSESYYRYMHFFLASHLLVSVAPFVGGNNIRDFWAFNKTLFVRILLTMLYVGVLFTGLTIAIYSIETLLEFDISGVRYAQLAVFLIGIFGTWFFLGTVPRPDQLTADEKRYPKGMRIFVQYVLIPLIVVYMVILYLYMGKILIEWEWPSGWVANLVLNFSIAGILGLLLLYPIQDEEDHQWVRLFSRGYYIALTPLIVLLMLSIWVRISEYGVTVNRYLVATLAVWLTLLVLYFLISKRQDIRMIPGSLIVVIALIIYGPFSAFDVSERSQLSRLEENLEMYGLLGENGTVNPVDEDIPFEGRKQISSGITYLLELSGTESIQPYFEQDLDVLLARQESPEDSVTSDAEKVTSLMGFEYVNDWEMAGDEDLVFAMFQVQKDRMNPVPLEGYEQYIGPIELWSESFEREIETGGQTVTLSYSPDTLELIISVSPAGEDLVFGFRSFIDTLPDTGGAKVDTLPVERMTMERQQEEGTLSAKLVFNSLNGQRQNGEISNVNANFGLYFSF